MGGKRSTHLATPTGDATGRIEVMKHNGFKFTNYSKHPVALVRHFRLVNPIIIIFIITVVDVMKMGNIVPRGELEPTCLAVWASVLPFHHVSLPYVTTIPPCLPVYAAPCLSYTDTLVQSMSSKDI